MRVLEFLNQTTQYLKNHQIESPRLNAELMLARSMNLAREEFYTHLHDPLKEGEKEIMEKMIQRRISGEPLQYILEHQEFWSIDLKVDPRVLIPRPETELLVEQSLLILSEISVKRTPSVLEIGTGSGAIAIALVKEVKPIFLVATDISIDALVLAKENAESEGVRHQIEFVNGDLFGPFCAPRGRTPFDLILSNPPYIVHSEIGSLAKEVREYEPFIALDGGKDGLEFYRRIITEAPLYLRERGWLLLEMGQGQSQRVAEQIERSGAFLRPKILPDLSGIERVVKAQKTES